MKDATSMKHPSVITEEFKTGRSESCGTLNNNAATTGTAAAPAESVAADAFKFKIEITNKTIDSNSSIVLS